MMTENGTFTELDGRGLQQGLHDAHVAVNDVARTLTGSKRGDHIRITDLLKTAGLPALNQMAIQSLATMTWDAFHSHDGQDHDRNGLGKTIFGTRNDNDVADVSNSNPVGVWGVWGCVGVGGVGSLLTFDIPQTALVATLDTYDFIGNSSIVDPIKINCLHKSKR
jgi:hypothetical protein